MKVVEKIQKISTKIFIKKYGAPSQGMELQKRKKKAPSFPLFLFMYIVGASSGLFFSFPSSLFSPGFCGSFDRSGHADDVPPLF